MLTSILRRARRGPVLALALLAATFPVLASSSYLVFVGTYTGPKSKGIHVFPFDPSRGTAGAPILAAEIANPSFLALAPDGKHLYAVGELSNFQGQKAGAVSAFAVDRATGKLALLNQVSSGGDGPCHITTDPQGRSVFVANYGGGSVAAIRIRPDGSLGDRTAFHQHQGSSVNRQRQEGPHAHGAALDARASLLVVPDLGLDRLMLYRWNASTGELAASHPPSVGLAPGSGPRHFSFTPDRRHGVSINELSSTLTLFAYEPQSARLIELQTLPTLPADFHGSSTTAEVAIHPNGRFVYASNRGHNSLAVFRVSSGGNRLELVEIVPSGGAIPRSFAITPDGRWLWAANQDSDLLALFQIDPKTGRLTQTDTTVMVGTPVCVQFLKAN